MVFRHISPDIKEHLVHLANEGYARGDILEFLGVSESSFWRWKRNVRDHGSVIPPRSHTQGRPRLLTVDATRDIYELMLESVRGTPAGTLFRSFPTESDPFPVVSSSFRPDSIRVCRTLYAFLLFVRGSIVRVIPLPD